MFKVQTILALCMLVHVTAFASSLGISQVRIHFNPEEHIKTLTLDNAKDTPIIIQFKVYAWSQHQQKDRYHPSKSILVSPPIAQIPPHSTQLLRLALVTPPAIDKQTTYRLLIREILPYTHGAHHQKLAVTIKLQYLLPIFIDPPTIIHHLVATKKSQQGQIQLENLGNTTEFINQIELFNHPNHPPIAVQSAFTYILPGQQHTWVFGKQLTRVATAVKFRVDGQFYSYPLISSRHS